MEDEIQDKLEEIYNFRIEVKFKDFRQYDVLCKVDNEKQFIIPFLYDARSTFEYNITLLKGRIEHEIIDLFKRKVNG
jgi:hypothetical protein